MTEELQKLIQRLERIEQETNLTNRLISVLIGNGSLHEIGGYVYGKTKEGEGDPFVILYPAAQGLKHKACRVYVNDFTKLPHFIPTEFPEGPEYVSDNPTKTDAIKRRIYHKCRQFTIATYDGPDTQMGPEQRFHSVIYVANQDGPPPAAFKVPITTREKPEPEKTEAVEPASTHKEQEEQIRDEEESAPHTDVDRTDVALVHREEQPTTPPTWTGRDEGKLPLELLEIVQDVWGAAADDPTNPHINNSKLLYGNTAPVPENQVTYELYAEYLKQHEAVPQDKKTLKAFYEEKRGKENA
jgi:hypothetical protein